MKSNSSSVGYDSVGSGFAFSYRHLFTEGVDEHCWCWELALASQEAAVTLVARRFSPLVAACGTGVCAVKASA